MNMDELFEFIEWENRRLNNLFDKKGEPKTKYTIFAKLIEEVGELSQALLADDNLQKPDKKKIKMRLEHELVDVVFSCLILAEHLEIDVKKAMLEKIEKIKKIEY